jgi:hypothetical protein
LEEEQAQGLHSFDWRDFSAELEELHEHVARVESERTISHVLPIRDIPEHPKSARDVLMATGLSLEHLWEEHASSVGSWV